MKNQYLTNLKTAPVFDVATLRGLHPDVTVVDLDNYIKYWVKTEKIYRLSRGLYVARDAWLKYQADNSYREFVASKLSYPSYLSSDYVLGKHNVITEGVMAMTSVTLKERKERKNILGNYIFNQITPKLFTGYRARNFLAYEYFEATKVKALFDYLYIRLDKINIAGDIWEELRLNMDEFTKGDGDEFAGYVGLVKNSKLVTISQELMRICTR